MFPINLYLTQRMIELHTEEMLRRAETRRLLRQARVDRQGWLSRQARWLSYQSGRLLVALGQRLQRIGVPRTIHIEGGRPCEGKSSL